MPRVVPDQRSKFDNEEFFRKLSRECEVSVRERATHTHTHTLETVCETAEIKTREGGSLAEESMLEGCELHTGSFISYNKFSGGKPTAGYNAPKQNNDSLQKNNQLFHLSDLWLSENQKNRFFFPLPFRLGLILCLFTLFIQFIFKLL